MSRPELQMNPLGDQAVLVSCGDESTALSFADATRRAGLSWVVDVVQAYFRVAVFYDLAKIDFDHASNLLRAISPDQTSHGAFGKLHVIPCCYELGLDLGRIAEKTGLTREEIIALHIGAIYTVYAIGFCPGFPYLGYLPERLCGVPRLETPRLKVEAGSIGLTGRQTGIYTEARPGGWNIVGRTPLELVNVADGYFPIRTGDRVRFERIDERRFETLIGKRIDV